MSRLLALCLTVFSLPGLAEEFAKIHIYAQRQMTVRSWISISCGSATVAELKRGTFFTINVTPGRYTLVPEGGVPIFVNVSAGEEAFIRLGWNSGIDRSAVPILSSVRSADADKELMHLSYIPASKVLSDSVSKTDPRKPEELRLKKREDR